MQKKSAPRNVNWVPNFSNFFVFCLIILATICVGRYHLCAYLFLIYLPLVDWTASNVLLVVVFSILFHSKPTNSDLNSNVVFLFGCFRSLSYELHNFSIGLCCRFHSNELVSIYSSIFYQMHSALNINYNGYDIHCHFVYVWVSEWVLLWCWIFSSKTFRCRLLSREHCFRFSISNCYEPK